MRFFWPSKLNPDATALVRLGRVLHWMGSAVGLGFCLLWLAGSSTQFGYPATQLTYIGVGILGGLLFSIVGRALRYIFSGE